ncbi:hypothetical protein IWW47_003667 [Coemansia sp. RSA 2052]|nr:hypothetical protein IWW47_003667 [Coemansia sp. RSA 2052]
MRHLLATITPATITAQIANVARSRLPAASMAAALALRRRHYTNTSVYTRVDAMTPEEHLRVLLEEQRYLIELLKTDDSQAPWCRDTVVTVSREVQQGLHQPQDWFPDQVLGQ